MSTFIARNGGQTGARSIVFGTISTGATWSEDVEITQDGTFVTDAETWDWRFTFRDATQNAPSLTLSTDAGTLAIVQGAAATTLQIRVAASSLSNLSGDFIADLASKDAVDGIIHWSHGIVAFFYEPPVWG